MKSGDRQAGFALPVAMLALVLIGALVSAGFYAASEQDTSSSSTRDAGLALYTAERGLQEVIGTRSRAFFEDSIAMGDTATIGPVASTLDHRSASYTAEVRRVATRLFLIDVTGRIHGRGASAGASRRVAQLVRTVYFGLSPETALMTRDTVRILGRSSISGTDVVPSGWSGCSSPSDKAGIVTDDSTKISSFGRGALTGNPPATERPLSNSDFYDFGDVNFSDLAAMADKIYPSGTFNGMAPVLDAMGGCDQSVRDNWGEPYDVTSPCHYYWPIIDFQGDAHLSSGYGQGILLVDGDLYITGNFEFSGIVIVTGAMLATGTGNKITGTALISGNGQLGDTGGRGQTNIYFSSCAVERAMLYNQRVARAFPVSNRSWMDLTGAGATSF